MKNKLKYYIITLLMIFSTFTSYLGVNAIDSSTQESKSPKNINELIQGDELEAFLNMEAPKLDEQKIYFTFDEIEGQFVPYDGFTNYGVGDLYNLTINQKQYKYFITVSGFNHWGWWSVIYNPLDDKYVYCIDVATPILGGDGYIAFNFIDVISDFQLYNDLRLIGTYGQKLQRDGGGDYMYFATNLMVWERQGGYNGYTTDTFGNIIDLSSQRNQISNAITDHYKNPSFNHNNITLKIGESITLNDSNGVFKDYFLKTNTTGLSLNKNGNSITLTANTDSHDGVISFSKNENLVYPSFIYKKSNSQSISQLGLGDPIFANLNITVLQNGNLKLIKKDTTGALVQGAVFDFSKNADMSNSSRHTTDANGQILLNDYPQGDYYIREVSTPAPLIVDSTIRKVSITANTTNTEEITNAIAVGYIDGVKFESSNSPQHINKNLQGAVYEVKNSSNVVVDTITTDANGYFKTKNLPLGKYTIKETKAPIGYNLDTSTYTVDLKYIDYNTPVVSTSISLNDKVISGKVRLIKTSFGGTILLPGAKFGIYEKGTDNLVQELTTNAFGIAESTDLRYGEYYLKEISAPDGYYINLNTFPFNIDVEGEIEHVIVNNQEVRAKVMVKKVDGVNHEPLANVGFSVADEQMNIIEFDVINGTKVEKQSIFYTDADGELLINNYLYYGTYYLVESETPFGYEPIAPVQFKIDEKQTFIEIPVIGTVKDFNIINNRKVAKLQINKTDAITNESLKGFIFNIYDKEGYIVDVVVTDDNGFAESHEVLLYNEQYKIVEVATGNEYYVVPDGNEEVILINEDIKVLDITNTKSKYDLAIKKIDEYTKAPLIAEFEVIENETGQVVASGTTDENGNLTIPLLEYGKDYILKETKAPIDYFVMEDIEFNYSIDDYDNPIELVVTNAYSILDLHLLKMDGFDFKMLPDAEYTLSKVLEDGTKEVVDVQVTDENGEAYFKVVKGQEYCLLETQAPQDYFIDETEDCFTVTMESSTFEMTKEKVNHYMLATMSLAKVDEARLIPHLKDTSIPASVLDLQSMEDAIKENLIYLEGATYELHHQPGGVGSLEETVFIEEQTSDVNGKMTFNNLIKGETYCVIETKAPENYNISLDPYCFTVSMETTEFNFTEFVSDSFALIDMKLIKLADTGFKRLPGAKFNLYTVNDDGTETFFQDGITDENGEIYFSQLTKGAKYHLVETAAPEGYKATVDEVFETTLDSTTFVFDKTVYNGELPKTGIPVSGSYLFGVTSLAAGILAVQIKRKKEQE